MVPSKNIHLLAESLVLVILTCWVRTALPQVTVQVREALQSGEEYIVLKTYTFPEGFLNPLNWFVTSYANIPPEGTTAVLYRPHPDDLCSEIQPVQFCSQTTPQVNATQYGNLTRWALVSGYHTCTQKKIEQAQEAGFDGMITFCPNSSIFDYQVSGQVLDRTSGTYFNVKSTGFPIVVVSEQFAGVLREIAVTDTNTTKCFNALVSINGDPVRHSWIMFAVAFAMVIVLVGLPLLTCLCVCCCLCDLCVNGCPKHCCQVSCGCCKTRGIYQVNQVHTQTLGDGLVLRQPRLEEETTFATRGDAPVERFQRVFENNPEPSTRKYHAAVERNMSCAICLECFDEEETVHALSCNEHHVFHPHCIEQWLDNYNVCPVCRAYVIQPSF